MILRKIFVIDIMCAMVTWITIFMTLKTFLLYLRLATVLGLKLYLNVSKNSREAEGYAQIFIFDQKLVDCRIAWMSLSPVFCLLTGWILHFPKLKSRTVEDFPVIHPRLWPAQCWYTCVKLIFITHPPVFRVTSNLGAVWLGPQCHVTQMWTGVKIKSPRQHELNN